MKKQQKRNLIIGIIAIILVGSILAQTGFLKMPFAVSNEQYIQAPTFYYYECSPASQPVESIHTNLITGSSGWILIPFNTDTADLWVSQTEKTKWYSQDRRIVYQICHNNGANCDTQRFINAPHFILSGPQVPSVHIPNLLTTDRIFINYQYRNLLGQWKDQPNGASWYHTYKPFILWKVDMFGGGKNEYTSVSQGCNFPSSAIGNLIDSVTNLNKQLNTQTSSSDTSLPFYKTRNFIGTYVPISTANVNFVTYNGQLGYCLQRQVFAISKVVTNGQTYQIVDNNFNTRLANSVTCCPGETEPTRKCNSNFGWDTISVAQCSSFNACAGANWQDSSSKTQIRYNCINGRCVSETRKVECVYNSDCGGVQQQCDSYTHKCIEVSPGTITCLPNQTLFNGVCTNKLISDCKWYQEPYTKESKDYGTFGWRHIFGNPITTEVSGCKISGLTYGLIIVVFFVIIPLLIILFFILKKSGSRKKKK